jgi:hypothetical protein
VRMKRRYLALFAGFCLTVVAGASSWPAQAASTDYEQPVIFENDTSVIDVLIVPPNHGQLVNDSGILAGLSPAELTPFNTYVPAIEQSVHAFKAGVDQFGPEWLRRGLVLNVFVLGRDTVPTDALNDPEVIILTDETKLDVLGIAVTALDPCIVDNSKLGLLSLSFEDMYNINGQEFGHCLGLEHVAGPRGDQVLKHDVLNGVYSHEPGLVGTHRHCVSNLNVLGLEQVFKRVLGQGEGGATSTMAPSAYRQIAC